MQNLSDSSYGQFLWALPTGRSGRALTMVAESLSSYRREWQEEYRKSDLAHRSKHRVVAAVVPRPFPPSRRA